MFWDLNVQYPSSEVESLELIQQSISNGFTGICWNKKIEGKLSIKHYNDMKFIKINDKSQFEYSSQHNNNSNNNNNHINQSTLRTHQAKQSYLSNIQSNNNNNQSSTTTTITTNNNNNNNNNSSMNQLSSQNSTSLPAAFSSFHQLSRLTIVISSISDLQPLLRNSSSLTNSSPLLKVLISYDIIAIEAVNEQIFHASAQSDLIDIIQFNSSHKLPYYLKFQTFELLKQKGIYIEISYNSSLINHQTKRYLFSLMTSLIRIIGNSSSNKNQLSKFKKSTGIIITSESSNKIHLRSSSDVINLGQIVGLTCQQARASIETNCQTIIQHAKTKRTNKGVIIENTNTSKNIQIENEKLKQLQTTNQQTNSTSLSIENEKIKQLQTTNQQTNQQTNSTSLSIENDKQQQHASKSNKRNNQTMNHESNELLTQQLKSQELSNKKQRKQ